MSTVLKTCSTHHRETDAGEIVKGENVWASTGLKGKAREKCGKTSTSGGGATVEKLQGSGEKKKRWFNRWTRTSSTQEERTEPRSRHLAYSKPQAQGPFSTNTFAPGRRAGGLCGVMKRLAGGEKNGRISPRVKKDETEGKNVATCEGREPSTRHDKIRVDQRRERDLGWGEGRGLLLQGLDRRRKAVYPKQDSCRGKS